MNSSTTRLVNTDNAEIELSNFKPVDTIKVALFHFIYTLSLGVMAIVLKFTKENEPNTCGQLSVLCFSQSALWILSIAFDDYYRRRHSYLRIRGHFTYQKKLNDLISPILNVVSLGTVVILITLGILYQINFRNMCQNIGYTSPTCILLYFFGFEIIILIPLFINYMIVVNNLNNGKPPSDVEELEWKLSADTRTEIGYCLENDGLATFVEKQADIIEYYKKANNDLNKHANALCRLVAASRLSEEVGINVPTLLNLRNNDIANATIDT